MMVEAKESEHMMEALLRLLNGILSAKKIYGKYVECIEKIVEYFFVYALANAPNTFQLVSSTRH